jgi:hypothetical protein
VTSDEQLRGDDCSDAGFVEQRGCEDADVFGDLALELVRFRGRCLGASREHA